MPNRKEDILDSAEALARARGFDAFSYADIERDVGIRKASIHHHFPAKADLGLALVERYRSHFEAALASYDVRRKTAGERLSDYLQLYNTALSDGQSLCLCVAFSAGRDSLSEAVLTQLNAFHENSIAWLTALFEQGASDGSISNVEEPENEAYACLAAVEGGQIMARAAEDTARFEAAVTSLRARIQ